MRTKNFTEPTKIPLGEKFGKTIYWEPHTHPNLFITGYAGSGKTYMQQLINQHIQTHNPHWDIYWKNKYEHRTSEQNTISNHIDYATHIISKIHQRYHLMFTGKKNESNLQPILFMIDDANMIGDEIKYEQEQEELNSLFWSFLKLILEKGPQVNIYTIISSQPTPHTLQSWEKTIFPHIQGTIISGKIIEIASLILTGTTEGIQIPNLIFSDFERQKQ